MGLKPIHIHYRENPEMPRLFDLLSENSKKDLIEENRKIKNSSRKATGKNRGRSRSEPSTQQEKVNITVPDFVALDVETTGLDFKNDRIIEIGAVRFRNGKPVEEFSTLVSPGIPIPQAITDLTGIADADLNGAPLFAEIADRLLSFIDSQPLCGHQIEFDTSFLKEELKRIGKPPVTGALIDTALLSRILLDPQGRFSLKHVCGVLEIKLDNAHRALDDARASGEAAARLIPEIAGLSPAVRRTIAACAPSSILRTILYQTLGGRKPEICLEFPYEKPPVRLSVPDRFREIDHHEIEALFSERGGLASRLASFSPRPSQLKMARGVTDALNTRSLYIAEAGTGTGKSLAYLVPAAFWAMENGCRIIVSTRTRNLQDQLVSKDLPAVISLTGDRLRSSVLKGRSNYLCLNRFQQLLRGDIGNLSPRERFAILPLIVWSSRTPTGDIEEQNQFNPKWFTKIWNLISADHHECGHRRCPLYGSCFLQKARNRALGAHLVIINHSLFFSDICAETSFLGPIGPLVFDEAHHLESSGYRYLRVELDTNRINVFTEIINNLVQRTGGLKEEKRIHEGGKAVRASLRQFRKRSGELLERLTAWARERNPQSPEYQLPCTESMFSELPESGAFIQATSDLAERLLELRQSIKSLEAPELYESYELDAQTCADHASQLKADFLYLVAARTEDHVFWIEGNHQKGWTKLCGVPLDVGSLLSEIWDRCNGAVVFTSATLSIAQSVDYFKRGAGLCAHESRTFSDLFKSPFGSHQYIAGAVGSAPDPDSAGFPAYVAGTVAGLHGRFSKNTLVLFTANSMLSAVYQLLRDTPGIDRNRILAQNMNGSRQVIIEEFRKNTGMILLGTDSFWEGIDVPGEACEIVVIPRLPFPVPTHPLTQAIAQRMQRLEGESFFSYSVPEAVIRFRQGAGRLIRTATDRGALVVLDNRIVTRGYGKQFTRSLEGNFHAFEDNEAMLGKLGEFFSSEPGQEPPVADLSYVPLEDA